MASQQARNIENLFRGGFPQSLQPSQPSKAAQPPPESPTGAFSDFTYGDYLGTLLPADKRRIGRETWTRLARKYGHPIAGTGLRKGGEDSELRVGFLRNTGKSGLTPIPKSINPTSPSKSMLDFARLRERLKKYQQIRLHGFTAAELAEMETLNAVDDTAMQCELGNAIHPLFAKDRWCREAEMPKDQAYLPIYGDYPGDLWDVDNDLVWNLLEPCVILASAVLQHQHIYPWLDALLWGERKDVVPERNPGSETLRTFHLRPSMTIEADQARTAATLVHMAKKVNWRLTSGYDEYGNNLCRDTGFCEGETEGLWDYEMRPNVRVNISIQMLQPLLLDLTDAERLEQQFNVADLLLHELAHAVYIYQTYILRHRPKLRFEPYFEDEIENELGWSFNSNLWDGIPRHFAESTSHWRHGPGLPGFGIFRSDLSLTHLAGAEIELLKPLRRQIEDIWPVPVAWTQKIFQTATWEVLVKKYGKEGTRLGPLKYGTRKALPNDFKTEYFTYLEAIETHMLEPMQLGDSFGQLITSIIPLRADMKPAEREQIKENNDRLTHAARIRDKMRGPRLIRAVVQPNPNFPVNPDAELDFDAGEGADENVIRDVYEISIAWVSVIMRYLNQNRGPLELGLDTMGFVSEPTLYRYIRDRGGLDITPQILRSFLAKCNEKRELFLWQPFPGGGLVKRIRAGWPPARSYSLNAPSEPVAEYEENLIRASMSNEAIRKNIYQTVGESRDIDAGILCFLINLKHPAPIAFANPQKLENAAIQCVRKGTAVDFTLGPKGIIRTLYDLTPYRNQIASQWEKERLASFPDI